MISIKINGSDFLCKPFISILEACKNVGITIPRFCYHELLSISGNCRMCLIEVENMEKPVASCVMEVEENMSIKVDSPFVKKARENVLEALLLNHPLDCPICDQAGECDLQDQTKTFASSHNRFRFLKKSSENKYCGPLIKTIMTRCITCTRCVRYAEEIAGVNYFGSLNRGLNTEIGNYIPKMFNSEISGNVIDLCPVGALTSKPYAFKARPWELRLTESIDTTDSYGSSIYLNYKGHTIFRILPKSNSDINQNLISDKARFSYDSNHNERIKNLYVFDNIKKKYKILSWKSFFKNINNLLNKKSISFLINQETDLETLICLRNIKNNQDKKIIINDTDDIYRRPNFYLSDQINATKYIDNLENLFIMLGSNIRLESALLNARIKFMHQNSSLIGIIMGSFSDVNIPSVFCSLNLTNIIKIFEARFINTPFILNNSVKTVLFIGDSFFSRSYNTNTFINFLKNKFINILTLKVLKSSNSDGLNFLNIKKNYYNKQDSIVTINPKENIITNKTISKKKNDNIYIGDQGSFVAAQHKYIVPTTNIYESDYKYLNYEHRCQKTTQIFTYINQSKKLSNLLLTMFNKNKSLVNLWSNHLEENILFPEKYVSIINNFLLETNKKYIFFHSERTKFFNYPIKLSIKNFYLSSKSSSYSKIMKSCSQELHKNFKLFY